MTQKKNDCSRDSEIFQQQRNAMLQLTPLSSVPIADRLAH